MYARVPEVSEEVLDQCKFKRSRRFELASRWTPIAPSFSLEDFMNSVTMNFQCSTRGRLQCKEWRKGYMYNLLQFQVLQLWKKKQKKSMRPIAWTKWVLPVVKRISTSIFWIFCFVRNIFSNFLEEVLRMVGLLVHSEEKHLRHQLSLHFSFSEQYNVLNYFQFYASVSQRSLNNWTCCISRSWTEVNRWLKYKWFKYSMIDGVDREYKHNSAF